MPRRKKQESGPQFAIEKLAGTKEAAIRLNPALPGIPHTILSVGRTRSGKTTTAVQMYSSKKFPFKAAFGNGKRGKDLMIILQYLSKYQPFHHQVHKRP